MSMKVSNHSKNEKTTVTFSTVVPTTSHQPVKPDTKPTLVEEPTIPLKGKMTVTGTGKPRGKKSQMDGWMSSWNLV